MATKKQKHQAALARRERHMAENRRTGLAALQRDRDHRLEEELQAWEDNHEKNHSWTKRIVECPHCRAEMKAARQAAEDQSGPEPADAIALDH